MPRPGAERPIQKKRTIKTQRDERRSVVLPLGTSRSNGEYAYRLHGKRSLHGLTPQERLIRVDQYSCQTELRDWGRIMAHLFMSLFRTALD